MVSQGTLLAADHEHVAVAVMLAVDDSPRALADADDGTPYEQLVPLPLSSKSPHAAQSALLFDRESVSSSRTMLWPCHLVRSSCPDVQWLSP